jgi:hypothetical protein
MRKLLLTVLLAVTFGGVFAQKLDDIKEKVQKAKYDEAKEKIDKAFAEGKGLVSDHYFYRAKTYYHLNKTKQDPAMATTALESMKKYMEMEAGKPEGMRMLLSTLDNNNETFYGIYSEYFNQGIKNFKSEDYAKALASFKLALEAFNFLSQYKLTPLTFDTTVTIYAGFSAQNAKMFEEAAGFYDKMINAKIYDTNYLDAYRFMINYNLDNKKDTAAALRYLEISEKAFPMYEDLWIDYEMMVMGSDRANKINRYEQLGAMYPNNFVVALNHAVELYNHTFFSDPKPANYLESQDQTRKALERALTLDPNNAHGNYILSQYYVNQIYDIEDSIRAVRGTTAADAAKKKEMNARLDAKYESLYTYSQKAYDLFTKDNHQLKAQEKANLRRVVNQLIDYHTRKKQADKVAFYQDKLKQL